MHVDDEEEWTRTNFILVINEWLHWKEYVTFVFLSRNKYYSFSRNQFKVEVTYSNLGRMSAAQWGLGHCVQKNTITWMMKKGRQRTKFSLEMNECDCTEKLVTFVFLIRNKYYNLCRNHIKGKLRPDLDFWIFAFIRKRI